MAGAQNNARRLILQMQYSLDGFVGGPNGELDWVFENLHDEYEGWGAGILWDASAHLMGSVTYQDMAAHWPASTEPYAAPMNQIPKIVFSKSLTEADWTDTQVISGDLATEIARLKQEPGKPLLAHGDARFAQSLVQTALVDEYRLITHLVALGSGLRLFPDRYAPLRLKLVDEKPFKSGVVARVYHPAG